MILVERSPGGRPSSGPRETFASRQWWRAAAVDGGERIPGPGGDCYRVTTKGRLVARLFGVLKHAWRLGRAAKRVSSEDASGVTSGSVAVSAAWTQHRRDLMLLFIGTGQRTNSTWPRLAPETSPRRGGRSRRGNPRGRPSGARPPSCSPPSSDLRREPGRSWTCLRQPRVTWFLSPGHRGHRPAVLSFSLAGQGHRPLPYYGPASCVEESAYTYTSSQNYLSWAF